MDDKLATERPGGAAAELAARQHGVVSARQLYSLGLTREQLVGRIRRGWLQRLHRGVYAVGYRPLTREGRWMAAVLALGEGAVLSHRPAAALWGICGWRPESRIDVTVPSKGGRGKRPGISVHRCASLAEGEMTSRRGIPVTTPARTILDLAALLDRRGLERALDEADRLRLCGLAELREVLRRRELPGSGASGFSGVRALRAALATHDIGSTATRSELEERFLALCRESSLPRPLVNTPLLAYVVDFLWPAARLAVELDGHASHGTRGAFQRDRNRDSDLAAHGYRTLRFTWWDVTSRPRVVADRVARVLGVEPAPGRGPGSR